MKRIKYFIMLFITHREYCIRCNESSHQYRIGWRKAERSKSVPMMKAAMIDNGKRLESIRARYLSDKDDLRYHYLGVLPSE